MFQMFDKFISNSTAKHIITLHNNVLLLNCGHDCFLVGGKFKNLKTKKKAYCIIDKPESKSKFKSKVQDPIP